MRKRPRFFIVFILDWYGRFQAAEALYKQVIAFVTSFGGFLASAVAISFHAATPFLNALLTTLPLGLSVAIFSAKGTRSGFGGPLAIASTALVVLVGNALVTKWLGLGLTFDFADVFQNLSATYDFARQHFPYILIGPIIGILFVALFPVFMLWEYLRIYGILGFVITCTIGWFLGWIIGAKPAR